MVPMVLFAQNETNVRNAETARQHRVRLIQRIYDEGWQVLNASTASQVHHYLEGQKVSLIILDAAGYRGDRAEQFKRRRELTDAPILVITDATDDRTELEILDNGADDCLRRPVSDQIIIAHAKSLLRRADALPAPELIFDELRISLAEHVVELDGVQLDLTPKEFELLYYFAKNPNLALSRVQILNHAWGWNYAGEERTVDSHVKALRSKLGWAGRHIVTVRSVGYKFVWNLPEKSAVHAE